MGTLSHSNNDVATISPSEFTAIADDPSEFTAITDEPSPDEFVAVNEVATSIPSPVQSAQVSPSPNLIARAGRSFARGITQTVASIPESIAITAKKLADVTGVRMGAPPTVQESDLYKAAQAIKQTVPQETSGNPSFLTDTLPQGFGSAAGFIAGGLAGRALKVPALVSTALLGAASTASEGYQDAIANGADEDKAFQSFLLNAGVGLTEAVPFGRLVNRLSNATGGEFKRQLIKNATRSGLEEAIQETVQNTASNKIAQELYDPDRPLFKDVPQGAGAGGIVGFVFGLLTEAAGGHRARISQKEQPNAIQVEKPNEEVLREQATQPEQQLGLPQVGARNTEPGTITAEEIQQRTPAPPIEEAIPVASEVQSGPSAFETLAQAIAGKIAGKTRLTNQENELLNNMASASPEIHAALLKRVSELRGELDSSNSHKVAPGSSNLPPGTTLPETRDENATRVRQSALAEAQKKALEDQKNLPPRELTVFHGGNVVGEFDALKSGEGDIDGFYFSPDKDIAKYHSESKGGNIQQFKVTLKNPASDTDVSAAENAVGLVRAEDGMAVYALGDGKLVRDELERMGHDGVIHQGGSEVIVFNKDSIIRSEERPKAQEAVEKLPQTKVKQPKPKTPAQEFDDLVAEYGEQEGWGSDLEMSGHKKALSKGPQSGASVLSKLNSQKNTRRAAVRAISTIGGNVNDPSAIQKAELLPKLKQYLATKAAEKSAADTSDEGEYVPSGKDDPFAPEPFKVPAPIPKLRSGENQGDVFANQTEDFALVGEKATDAQKIADAKAKAERDAAEAKAIQDSRQRNLFSEPSSVKQAPSSATAAEVLNSSGEVALTVPEGATFIRVKAQNGKSAVVPIDSVKKGNVLQGAGPFVSVEAGIRDRKGEFKPVPGELSATPKTPTVRNAQSLDAVVANPITEQEAAKAVNQRLGTTEVPSNIRFTNDPEGPKGRVLFQPDNLPQIEINLAKHDTADSVKDTLVHELLHPVQQDEAMASAVRAVADMVQESDLSRKRALGYSESETPIEATNELILKFYQEHANSNIFKRAVTQVVIAAKRIFGIELTTRQAAVILVQDAVKNHVARASGEGLSRSEVGTTGEFEQKLTEIEGHEIEIEGRPSYTKDDERAGGAFVKSIFDAIGLPTTERENSTRALTPQASSTLDEVKGQELLAQAMFIRQNLERAFDSYNERAGAWGAWINSIRNIIMEMQDARARGETVAFSDQLAKDILTMAQSEASFIGMVLNSLRGMKDSILWTARNAAITLKTMRYESFGGPAVERFMTFIRKKFKEHWTMNQSSVLVANTALSNKLSKFALIDSDALTNIVYETLQTDVKNVQEFGTIFAQRFAEVTGTPVAEDVSNVFYDAVRVTVKNSLIRTIDPAYSAIGKDAKRALGKRTPIYRRLNRILHDGDLDFDTAVSNMAKNQGWAIPSPEELAKLRTMVEREQFLRTLSDETLAEIDALPETDRAAALDKAQTERNAATDGERAEIIKRINNIWSKWTKPTSWNLAKYLSPIQNLDIIQNNAQAVNEWITANLLLKLGFFVRQTIDVGVQTATHDLTRALGTAMITHKSEIARGIHTPQFWKDAGAAYATAWKLRATTLRHALAAARQGLKGKGLIKHSEQITQRLDIFERMMRTAEALEAEGKPRRAFMLRLVTWLRSALLFSRAMDLLSTTGAEYIEIAHRIRTAMKEQGKSNAEISQQIDDIFGNMTADWIDAYARAQQIFAETGTEPTKSNLDEAAGNIVRARAYTTLKIIDSDGQNFREVAEDTMNTIGWNERETAGIGGLVGNIVRGTQRAGERVGIPLAFVSAFGNAIATGINRKLTWMGLGWLAQFKTTGEGSPWYRTELDREQRLAEGFIGAGTSAFLAALAVTGAIVVRGFWPKDEREREKWRLEGRRAGTVEFPGDDGKFYAFSLSVGPFAMVAPSLVSAGEIKNLYDTKAKAQAKANEEAAKRGVTAARVDQITPMDWLGVAGSAFYASLLNSRTLGGIAGGAMNQGGFEPKQLAATVVSDVVPALPGWQDLMRVAGVYMNPRMATFGDMLLPLPTSGARKTNVLGDPSGTFDKTQQIIQTLTGGTFGPVDPSLAKKIPAYAALFAADYVPTPWQTGKGVVVDGAWRPLSRGELHNFVPLQGKKFADELTQIASEIQSAPKEEARKLAQAAYRRATDSALEQIGVDVEASKVQSSSKSGNAAPSSTTAPTKLDAERSPNLGAGSSFLPVSTGSRSRGSSGIRMRSGRGRRQSTQPRAKRLRSPKIAKPRATRLRSSRSRSRRLRLAA